MQLCCTVPVTALLCGVLTAAGALRGDRVALALDAGLVLLAAGAGAVALVGVAQRRA
jgi:hypothetical protein